MEKPAILDSKFCPRWRQLTNSTKHSLRVDFDSGLFASLCDFVKSCNCTRRVYLVLYADGILLLSPTVTELQNMLQNYKRELDTLDFVINAKVMLRANRPTH